MATRESDNIRVGANGDVYLARLGLGIDLPGLDDPREALDADFVEIGYASDDGVTFSFGTTVEDIKGWQKTATLRRLVTDRAFDVGVQLLEWKPENFAIAFGGGEWTETAPGVFAYAPPADTDALIEYAMVVDWNDGDHEHRAVIRKGTVTDDIETNLRRNAAALLPITLNALASDDDEAPWYYVTNDEAFAGVGS